MLTETERKEIFDVVQDYRKAHLRLADNYKDKRAHAVAERCSRRAGHYLYVMKQSLYYAGQDLNDDDIKCFALLVDSFEQMQRNRLLGDLQKHVNFDVMAFVGAYNRGLESKVRFTKKKEITELSTKDLERRIEKINRARRNIKKHRRTFHNMEVCDVIRDEAHELAHAVVNGKLKNYSKDYLESVRRFLDAVIINSGDGDIADTADKILVEKIQEMNEPMVAEDFVTVYEPEKESNESASDVEQTATDKESVKEKINRIRQKIEERKQKEREKIYQWKQRIEQQKAERKQKNREIAQERAKQIAEKKAEREQALREKIEQVRANIQQNAEEKRSEKLRKEAEQAEQARLQEIERQARQERVQERVDNAKKAVSDAAGKVAGGFMSLKDKLKAKLQAKKSEIETNRRNREIIRDAERASKEHWKELKREEKQKKHEEKQAQNQNEPNKNRNMFVRIAVASAAAIVLFGSIFMYRNNNQVEQKKEPVKKEVKEKPVVQKQEAAAVAIDTAYAQALVNYYNSALDIIAGAKKDDVISKINNQVKAGNIVLGDDYISAERVAYAYFIYREYGFNIDILNLAVNGTQKLTDAQQAELNKVIMDAGERGTGVQQMAKQRVEARGGGLSQHSKFKNATKQQQRQHLVNLGLLKKAHVK